MTVAVQRGMLFAIECVIACLKLRALGSLDVFVKPRALRTLCAYMWHRATRYIARRRWFSVPRRCHRSLLVSQACCC